MSDQISQSGAKAALERQRKEEEERRARRDVDTAVDTGPPWEEVLLAGAKTEGGSVRTYIVRGPRPLGGVDPGDELEHEFTPQEERALVGAKRLEIVPQTYQVVGPNKVFEHESGAFFTAALFLDQEQALVYGGHIELVASGQEKDPFKGKTRDELNELAASAGVENPGDYRTKDDVIRAIKSVSQPSPEGD